MIAAHGLRRRMQRVDSRHREGYLQNTPVPRLHIGGGSRCLPGWLNTDIALAPDVVQMDATRPFPFEDSVFHYAFTEHMIEHVSFESAMFMLRECYRVLKTGGVIRITTPNLASIVGLYGTNLSELQLGYLNHFCRAFLAPDSPATPANAINAMFRHFGHQFIYDEVTLGDALLKAGFGEIRRNSLMQSERQELRNLENVGRYPEGLLEFESIALEARKCG
jgi:predicted SAM-dependent methyltransferase